MSSVSWYFHSFTHTNDLQLDPKSQKWDFEEIACKESTRRYSFNYLDTWSIRSQIWPLWSKGKTPDSEVKSREFDSHLGQKIYSNIFSFCYVYNLPYKFTFNKRLDEFKSPCRHWKKHLTFFLKTFIFGLRISKFWNVSKYYYSQL